MEGRPQSPLGDEEWTIVRDFTDTDAGHTLPRYEAKFVEDGGTMYPEDEVVLVKETNARNGRERMHRFPREVFERVVEGLQ